MKKILLIGELNQVVNSVNRYLATSFQTQLCTDMPEMVTGMVKVFEPDMAVICLVGIGELDTKILDYFNEQKANIPVLLIGTVEECNYYQKYYESEQFGFVIRPTTLSTLLQKCREMMKLTDVVEEEIKPVENDNRKKRIMVVDDSGILLRSVKAILEREYEVAVATSGQMALQRAKKKKPDLILLDYDMPEMDGRETLERLRADEELQKIPVVFLTGVADKEHIAAVLDLKPEGYLLKPIEQQRLLNAIENVLIGMI